jgi:Flp pilus assembly protein TadG
VAGRFDEGGIAMNRFRAPAGSTAAWRRAALRLSLRRFARAEDGTLLVFGLFLLVIMLMAGGLAVDLMRHEAERTRVQNTADRATLAAASLRQQLDPEAVVRDVFARAGLSENLTGVVVDEGLNFRNVAATTGTSVGTHFMRLLGHDRLQSAARSAAEERITNVEISLVLDISGSMLQNRRIQNLRSAADEFVREVLEDDRDNRISINLVPFNGQVNIGPALTARYNITHQHGIANVNCVDMPASVYNQIAFSRTLPMSQTAWADSFSPTTQSNGWVAPQAPNPANVWCPAVANNFVRPVANNIAQLRTQVQNLQAIGATSIDAGMRWGVALLDPNSRSVIDDLIAAGTVPAHFAGRPFDYGDPEVLKVVVLMTDGEHFPEERINDAFKSGTSPIFRSNGDGRYSIRFTSGRPACAGTNEFWVPHLWSSSLTQPCGGAWRAQAWNSGAGTTQLGWVQVWQQLRVQWVAWHLHARALGSGASGRTSVFNTWMANFRTLSSPAAMDARLSQFCTMARNNGIVVFGIAFEAPPRGVDAIRDCASPGLFHDVEGLEIETAFRTIRSQISKLRLTQ